MQTELSIEASLEWLLRKRYNAKHVKEISDFNVPVLITNTCTEMAAVVEEVRVHTLESLAEDITSAVTALRPNVSEIVCIVAWKQRCTLKSAEVVTSVTTANGTTVHFELFEYSRIINHPLRYNIVPSDYHRATPDELAQARQLATPLSRLPAMLESDPVARLLGFRRGDVIAFTRCLGSLPPALAFRCVVKG